MAEPLKNSFGPEIPVRIAAMVEAVHPAFASAEFVADCLDGYDALDLMPRARRISQVLARFLPADAAASIRILMASLGPRAEPMKGMEPFIYLPHVFFVAEQGIDLLDLSLEAQYELTQRFTAEFSIRAFIDRYPEEVLARLGQWASDPSAHVRRLVSEGTRPRLPWAPRLARFQADPRPVIELLELLKDDPEEYVRRSVANNLNDIAKDHPEIVVEVCRRWLTGASEVRRRLVRHALRTLIKEGHTEALALLGFGQDSPVVVEHFEVVPSRVLIGAKVQLQALLRNGADGSQPVLVDFRMHFVKADGATRPKVFKGASFSLAPGATKPVKKTVSLAQHTTRKHYPGRHRVEILLNGVVRGSVSFVVRSP
jgi:3-methyladenine DNA glycosylase AlkC